MEKTRYNSLFKRSYDLLLRYKLYENYYDNKNIIFNHEDLKVSDEIKIEFSKLYIKNMRTTLKDVNKHMERVIEEESNKKSLKQYKEKYKKYFEDRMSLETFKEFWEKENGRCCGYCGISEKQIISLDSDNEIKTKRFYSRGKTMEIDKIKADGEYTKCNIILSCYWCNNAKTDEFSLEDFKCIAKGINRVWNQRLSSTNSSVKFPIDTYKESTKKDCK